MAETIRCNSCGTIVSLGHKFCGGCGALLNPEEGEGTSRRPWYALRLVQEDGSDGELYELTEKGVHLSATEQSINSSTPEGKCFLDMLGVFAEFEPRLRHERQMEGIKKAKEKGVYKGRKQTLDVAKIKELASEGLMKTEIAKRLGIGRASVYRALND